MMPTDIGVAIAVSSDEEWVLWVDGLEALQRADCCGAADAFYEAARLTLDELAQRPEEDSAAARLVEVAPLAADVLAVHHDSGGAADLLEFALQRGRRDVDVFCPYITLLVERQEWALAVHLLGEALIREPHRLEYHRLERLLDAARAATALNSQGRNSHAQARRSKESIRPRRGVEPVSGGRGGPAHGRVGGARLG